MFIFPGFFVCAILKLHGWNKDTPLAYQSLLGRRKQIDFLKSIVYMRQGIYWIYPSTVMYLRSKTMEDAQL